MYDFRHAVTTIEEVPEAFRGLYSAVDGGSGFAIHPEFKAHIGGLSTALDKERKFNKTVKDELEKWKALGETPEAVSAKVQELTESAGGKANYEKLQREMGEANAKALKAKDEEVAGMQRTVETYLVDAEATTALSAAKGAPALLLPHVRSSVKVIKDGAKYVVRVVDKDGDPRGDGKGGFMTITDLVGEMKTSDTYGRAFEASGQSGGGKPPAGGGGKPPVNAGEMSAIQKISAGLRSQK